MSLPAERKRRWRNGLAKNRAEIMEYADIFDDVQQTRIVLMRKIAQAVTLNTKDRFVLKGGTGLLLGYGLPRYSTDLDFDGKDRSIYIDGSIEKACRDAGIIIEDMNIRKDTDTTKRYMLHYKGSENKPLKIEISYRQADDIAEKDVNIIDGIRIYRIEKLAELKTEAFLNRLKARDIYDVAFILERHPMVIKRPELEKIDRKIKSVGIDSLLDIVNDDHILQNADKEALILKLEENTAKRLHSLKQQKAKSHYSEYGR
jgi:predicted nucleotidyltransferase component of viral defense system